MINCNNGELKASGTVSELMADLCITVNALNKQFTKLVGEENAEKFLKKAFDEGMAGFPDKDIDKEIEKEIEKIASKISDNLLDFLKDLLNKSESEEQ